VARLAAKQQTGVALLFRYITAKGLTDFHTTPEGKLVRKVGIHGESMGRGVYESFDNETL